MLSKSDSDELLKIQKCCIRTVHKKSSRADCTPLFKMSNILPFNDLVELELMKLGYKISNGQIPKPITDIMNIYGGSETHGYNTRNKNIPNIQKQSTVQFNKIFFCKSILTYGSLPVKIKKSENLKIFIKRDKIQAN